MEPKNRDRVPEAAPGRATEAPGKGVAPEDAGGDFIRDIIREDLKSGKYGGRVSTRFPPEPNAYLHIGHAKSILLNCGIAQDFGGTFNLRFDDTNPMKEEAEYIDPMLTDVSWLGADWQDRLFYASDYFERFYAWAELLIKKGKAYVDDLTAEQIREHRGTLTEPGRESPYRNRAVEENLDLFRRMRAGEFPDGSRVLRAKIDMGSPNLNMRDPVLYRILRASHPHAGDKWCIYPMYDYAHPLEDAIEGITHSICTLEFEDHRPLYDWVIDEVEIPEPQPRQIEFARLNVTYLLTSKRKSLALIQQGLVGGWDDPRMPTISGLRRRGYTPEAIRDFCERIGVAKRDSTVDLALLEHCLREDLNKRAPRVMGVLRPVKLVLDNYPEGQVEEFELVNNPEDESAGTRKVPFSRVLYIDGDDFREVPPPKYYRLYPPQGGKAGEAGTQPGSEVRLRGAYLIRCTGVVKNAAGEVVEVHATYDPATSGGAAPDGRRVKGTIHWVSAAHAVDAEVRVYENLFTVEDPGSVADIRECINPGSLEVLAGCKLEPMLAAVEPGQRFQFERLGYFCVDPDTRPGMPVFNRTVSLRDSWAKIEKKLGG